MVKPCRFSQWFPVRCNPCELPGKFCTTVRSWTSTFCYSKRSLLVQRFISLRERQWDQSVVAPLAFLICSASQSLWSKGDFNLIPHSYVLEFSQCCLGYGWLLVGLLVKGKEVRNDVYCNLDDTIPSIFQLIIRCLKFLLQRWVLKLKRIWNFSQEQKKTHFFTIE